MAKHIAILGFIHAILGGLGALTGVGMMLFGLGGGLLTWLGGGEGAGAAGGLLALLGGGVGFAILASGLLGLVTGLGILGRRGWGRVLGVISSVLSLFNFPWFTILGVYGLWVLLSDAGGREFRRR